MFTRPTTRRTAFGIALAAAALTGSAFLPQAYAEPTATPAPTATPSAVAPTPAAATPAAPSETRTPAAPTPSASSESRARTATTARVTRPTTSTAPAVIEVTAPTGQELSVLISEEGTNWRAGATRGSGDKRERFRAEIAPPPGGWKPGRTYFVTVDTFNGISYDAFTGPGTPPRKNPKGEVNVTQQKELRAKVALPNSRSGDVVITVTGALPGATVEAAMGRRDDVQAESVASAKADAKGRAVLRLKADSKGWVPGGIYLWSTIETDQRRDARASGTLTMPAWGATDGTTKGKDKTKGNGTGTAPKDRTGGLPKTGV